MEVRLLRCGGRRQGRRSLADDQLLLGAWSLTPSTLAHNMRDRRVEGIMILASCALAWMMHMRCSVSNRSFSLLRRRDSTAVGGASATRNHH